MVRDEDALEYHSQEPHGKLSITPTKPCLTQRDLSLAYSPGVAAPCMAIHRDRNLVYQYTAKSNLIAVISNGTAVLGLGNIGPEAGKPVMEGKAVLFKRFADIDVFDIELASEDPAEVIRAIQLMEPTFGGINLEDIKAPECFVIEETLRRTMRIPVFHDDQHGTAIISGAALLNALEIAGKSITTARIVVNGAGASAISCATHFLRLGARPDNILLCDSKGVVYEGRAAGMNQYKQQFAARTSLRTLTEALQDADVFMGLSAAGCLTPAMLKGMARDPIVFALANPDPEIPYPDALAARPDSIVATGRSDFPNQVNNVLGFPAVFRGALDTRSTTINEEMMLAATRSLAQLAKENVPEAVSRLYGESDLRFGRGYIIPKAFDPRVVVREAASVAEAAVRSGVAQTTLDLDEYRERLEKRLGPSTGVTRVLLRKARGNPCRLVFPEGEDPAILRACRALFDEEIARPVVIGNAERIQAMAADLRLDPDGFDVMEPAADPRVPGYAERYFQMRQRKGVTRAEADLAIRNPNLLGALMVSAGDADALVTGVTTHYPDTIRPLLEVIPMRAGIRKASGLYLVITSRGQLYFLADCTVNIDPDASDLAEIAECASEIAREFDVEPRVALLSFSNFGSSRHPASAKVKRAAEILRERWPNLVADGEVQADVALNPERLEATYPFSAIRGGANVLVFPNLDAGNIAYKLLASLGGAQIVGPILMGLSKPVHVVQRGASVADVVNLAALAAVEAHPEGQARRAAGRKLVNRMREQLPAG